jgi:hypothetical protein
MPADCDVYINQENTGACVMVQSVDYSDTLGDVESDADMTDGVVISTVPEVVDNLTP